ncbi:calcium-binding mitochondrial carrier protein SCaMC-1-A [Selaginella moellendorffii]|uniref:calcium-binding mitochondrial carrier protein SCaMC-1-A n=1 Tax=Selaginella moellendorffii TaxID=88036 RepID=UPI000D1CCAF1|nr:calcium-binding mitochondrial carrier protein SCaMC-1-A [Selaginella moellendorffii]|eukprot:XP_024543930.1 calcium-binding mitochondrial carrier protein SCaMC-1-A [Selaginella moellendorffii]
MRNTPSDKDRAWQIEHAFDSVESHLVYKVLLVNRFKLDRLECGKQEIQAFLGQFTEQLSASLSSVGLPIKSWAGAAEESGVKGSVKEQGSFDFLRLSLPLDGIKHFQKSSGGLVRDEQPQCYNPVFRASNAVVNAADHHAGFLFRTFSSFVPARKVTQAPVATDESKEENAAPVSKLFPGFLVHVVEPASRDSPMERKLDVKTLLENSVFLRFMLRDVVAFTKIFGFKKGAAFARVQGEPSIIEPSPYEEESPLESQFETNRTRGGIPRFSVKLPNIENIMDLVPLLGKAPQSFPDKRKLYSVEDFFKYTEAEGRRLFDELDRDKDGQVTLEDLELAMRKRRLPQRYAREFLRRTKKHWLKKSFGWSEFLTLMEQKESVMLRAFNSLSVSKSGTLQKGQVLTLLRNAGLPATEENAAAMMRILNSDTEGSITYGQFRNFLVLLPPERLFDDPRMVWYEAATVVPMSPPIEVPAGSVLKSALAGGLACALSTSLLHPLDTLKTRVQASSTLSFSELISNIPNIGIKGLYRGSAPAIIGQFSSHGLRTGIFEASKLLLINVAPNVSELQVQSLASFCSTFLGTAIRIPCEVLKQRLQAGLYDNVGVAIAGTLRKDGWKGFFRGTGATLCREVPFYVAGMMIYEEAKKVVQNVIKRELAPWEVIAIGGLSGGLAAVFTTPFDVMKTRMMTSPPGIPVTMSSVTVKIVSEEGLLALFKGAVPRFFWIAPLGAMNFAGYELAKRAMEKKNE